MQKAKELIQSGLLGDFYGTEIHTIADQTRLKSPGYQSSWYASKEKAGGGHLSWLGIHYLDLIQFITGLKIRQVCGFVGNVGGQPIEVEDSAVLSLRFENGTLGTMQSAYYLQYGYQSQILIWGSLGWLRLSGGGTFERGAALLEQAILVPSNARWTSLTMGGNEGILGLGSWVGQNNLRRKTDRLDFWIFLLHPLQVRALGAVDWDHLAVRVVGGMVSQRLPALVKAPIGVEVSAGLQRT